jgi:DNA-binding CsgD family transcriptional regulator
MKKLIRVKIPGVAAAPRDNGAELIEDFLWSTEGLTDAEIAEIAGVSTATVQRWRRSGSHRLRSDLRRRLLRYVRRVQRERAVERQAA